MRTRNDEYWVERERERETRRLEKVGESSRKFDKVRESQRKSEKVRGKLGVRGGKS